MSGSAVVQTGGAMAVAANPQEQLQQPSPEWCDLTVKVVVFGSKGTGKTTLVNTLMARHGFQTPAQHTAAVKHGPIPEGADAILDGKKGTKTTTSSAPAAAAGAAAAAPAAAEDAGDDIEGLLNDTDTNEHTAVMRVGKQWVCMEIVDVPGDVCSMANFHKVLAGQTDSGASLALVGDVFIVCYDPSDPQTLIVAEGIMKMVSAQKDPLPARAVLCATKCDGRVTLPGSTQSTCVVRGKRIARDLGITHAMTSADDKGRGVDECFSLAIRQALLSLEMEQSWCICC